VLAGDVKHCTIQSNRLLGDSLVQSLAYHDNSANGRRDNYVADAVDVVCISHTTCHDLGLTATSHLTPCVHVNGTSM